MFPGSVGRAARPRAGRRPGPDQGRVLPARPGHGLGDVHRRVDHAARRAAHAGPDIGVARSHRERLASRARDAATCARWWTRTPAPRRSKSRWNGTDGSRARLAVGVAEAVAGVGRAARAARAARDRNGSTSCAGADMGTSALEFEKPLRRGRKADRGAPQDGGRARDQRRRRDRAARAEARRAARVDLREPHADPARAGRAQPAAAVHARLHPARVHRLDRAARRPRVPRRSGDRRRLGAHRRRDGHGDRPAARARHQGESAPQLRDAPPRGLSQGAPAHEARREVPRAGS